MPKNYRKLSRPIFACSTGIRQILAETATNFHLALILQGHSPQAEIGARSPKQWFQEYGLSELCSLLQWSP